MNSAYLPEHCLCGATDCQRCFPAYSDMTDVSDRMAELRVEHLWSAEGFVWFREFEECQASVTAAETLHKALRLVYQLPDGEAKSLLREYMKAAEKFCADNDDPWILELAESELIDGEGV